MRASGRSSVRSGRSASTRSRSPAVTTPGSSCIRTDEAERSSFRRTAPFISRPTRHVTGTIKPVPSRLVRERDILREIGETSQIAVNVWLVLLHNSRLGELHPQSTVRNAFGDHYIYSLCPSAPDVRAYAVALCRDVTDSYPVSGISLETPGFMPYAHGYHHEFAMVRSHRWLDSRLGLCFCGHCVRGAEAAGIDASRLKARVREDIESYLAGEVDFPEDMAEAFWLGDVAADRTLAAFHHWRCDVVTSLVAEIRASVRSDANVAVIPSVARPTGGAWHEGSDLRALAEAAGIVEACFYERKVERIRADAFDTARRLNGAGSLRGILRPSFPDLETRSEVVAAAAEPCATRACPGIAFYNYGMLRRPNLAWIADALSVFGA